MLVIVIISTSTQYQVIIIIVIIPNFTYRGSKLVQIMTLLLGLCYWDLNDPVCIPIPDTTPDTSDTNSNYILHGNIRENIPCMDDIQLRQVHILDKTVRTQSIGTNHSASCVCNRAFLDLGLVVSFHIIEDIEPTHRASAHGTK